MKTDPKSTIIQIAAELLINNHLPSDLIDDYPQKTYSAARVAKMMEPAHDHLRKVAIRVGGAEEVNPANLITDD